MTEKQFAKQKRKELLAGFFKDGVPRLWCPLLTHYDEKGAIDANHIKAHLKHLSQHLKGFLILGSTGDGWELTEKEGDEVLSIVLKEAPQLKLHILIGVLNKEADETQEALIKRVHWLKKQTAEDTIESAFTKFHVCAFTVCAPTGKDLSQQQIGAALSEILELGHPTSLYQLPQITQNEMSPDLVATLAQQFENFIIFKDTSGKDQVALSGQKLLDVVLLRGAEGDYSRFIDTNGGPYHGFLLSSANCFPRELTQIITDIGAKRVDQAVSMSNRLSDLMGEMFQLVTNIPAGNAFTNANKALDHFFAHGKAALKVKPPRLHKGIFMPVEIIEATEKILRKYDLLPAKGYLE